MRRSRLRNPWPKLQPPPSFESRRGFPSSLKAAPPPDLTSFVVVICRQNRPHRIFHELPHANEAAALSSRASTRPAGVHACLAHACTRPLAHASAMCRASNSPRHHAMWHA
uniref:Uncharacterized protein n=1 Tax=Fagus sylvatica TaxID=28930 RepID=A0A2N9HFJ1_FAGSY